MKIIYLLPPSEWKNSYWKYEKEKLTFNFEKPLSIAINAQEKDLKCSWNRYEEGIKLNENIEKWKTIESIKRYSWIMYNAIDYENMSENTKKYFNSKFLIFSWMYGILKPTDKIGNYKLPIETKWLINFWWDKITKELNNLNVNLIIDFLPNSYKKMINKKLLNKKIIEVNFFYNKTWKKLTHWVKKIKWEYIKKICENNWIEKLDTKAKDINIYI